MVNIMKFSIIHLTDIHMKGQTDNYICSRTSSIIHAINSVLFPGEVAIIVVSGDIAFSGQESEYRIAKDFFDQIKSGIRQEKGIDSLLLAVPGNHDCDFSKANPVRTDLCPNQMLNQMLNQRSLSKSALSRIIFLTSAILAHAIQIRTTFVYPMNFPVTMGKFCFYL